MGDDLVRSATDAPCRPAVPRLRRNWSSSTATMLPNATGGEGVTRGVRADHVGAGRFRCPGSHAISE